MLPDGASANSLSLRELEELRERIRGSVDRTHDELERVEALIVIASLHERRRAREGTRGLDIGRDVDR